MDTTTANLARTSGTHLAVGHLVATHYDVDMDRITFATPAWVRDHPETITVREVDELEVIARNRSRTTYRAFFTDDTSAVVHSRRPVMVQG